MRILVLDFGGSSVKYALVDEDCQVLLPGRCIAPLSSPEEFVSTVEKIYTGTGSVAEGIAVSIPGYVNTKTGVLQGSGAYFNLYGENLVDLIHSRLSLPVAVENDGRCGALAEVWKGALADCNDGVVLILGTGVAGGIVKDRHIHAGKNLAAAEFSNYIVNPNQPNFLGEAVMNCAAFGLTYKLCKAKNLDLSCQNMGFMSPVGWSFQ